MTYFKDSRKRAAYKLARIHGNDPESSYYLDGRPHAGASHRAAYFHGRCGMTNSMYALAKNDAAYPYYAAGRDDRKIDIKLGNPLDPPKFEGPGGAPIYPKWEPIR